MTRCPSLIAVLLILVRLPGARSKGRSCKDFACKARELRLHMNARRNATRHALRIATQVSARLLQSSTARQPPADAVQRASDATHAYTVVGAAATGRKLSGIAVLSVRPDGPRRTLLSVLLMVHTSNMKAFTNPLGATLRAGAQSLQCAWVAKKDAFESSLLRLICHADGWNASAAMQSHRLDMSLRLSKPPALDDEISFTSEAISALLPPARVSVCMDLQYFGWIPKRDFDEWAFAQSLAGIERVYVPDQIAYRAQTATQAALGFAVASHDFPHRYVTPGGRSGPQNATYHMKEKSDGAANYLCLHEHWTDDWVGVAWTPDEYLTLEGLQVPPPTARTSLVAEALDLYARLRVRQPQWRFCVTLLCVNRPFYSPTEMLSGESQVWTLPNDGMQAQLSAKGQLGVERYTRRFTWLSKVTSNRKCFAHPDWRLGSKVRLHGFMMFSCPTWLKETCPAGVDPVLRRPCLELCGYWGNRTCDECVAPPDPGCGSAARGHMAAEGEIMEGLELAHFRVAPGENKVGGERDTTWLRNLSVALRPLVARYNSES